MGWEEILDAEGADMADAYNDSLPEDILPVWLRWTMIRLWMWESIWKNPVRYRLPAHGIRLRIFPHFRVNLQKNVLLPQNPFCLDLIPC